MGLFKSKSAKTEPKIRGFQNWPKTKMSFSAILGAKVIEKIFSLNPGKKSKKVKKKKLFSGSLCFEKLKQYLGGSAIFRTFVCEGVWKIAKPHKFGFSFSKQRLLEIFQMRLFSTAPVVHLREAIVSEKCSFFEHCSKGLCPPPLLFEHLSYFAGGVF